MTLFVVHSTNDYQHDDTQPYDTQHNDTQHYDIIGDTQHKRLSS